MDHNFEKPHFKAYHGNILLFFANPLVRHHPWLFFHPGPEAGWTPSWHSAHSRQARPAFSLGTTLAHLLGCFLSACDGWWGGACLWPQWYWVNSPRCPACLNLEVCLFLRLQVEDWGSLSVFLSAPRVQRWDVGSWLARALARPWFLLAPLVSVTDLYPDYSSTWEWSHSSGQLSTVPRKMADPGTSCLCPWLPAACVGSHSGGL